MIETRFGVLLISFLLGLVGGGSFFLLLQLHPTWDKQASKNFQKMNKTSKIFFILVYSAIGGVCALIGQYYHTEPVLVQSMLIGFNWPTVPRFVRMS